MTAIEGVDLNIYFDNGESLSLDLTPIQLRAVCKILGLKYNQESHSVSCLSDQSLKIFMEKTIDRWIDV